MPQGLSCCWEKQIKQTPDSFTFDCYSKSVSPPPTPEGKEQQGEQVNRQQEEVEVAIQEEPFWQEAPVHRPLKQKLTAKIESAAQVTNGILQEERKTQQKLQTGKIHL